jgi:hypothetical protein
MKKNIPALLVGIIGLIVIAVTLFGFFLLNFNKAPVNWWGLAFCLLSEIFLISIFILFKATSMQINKVFIRLGTTVVLIIYFVATSILCIFSNAFKHNLHLFIFIQIVLLALTVVIVLLLYLFSNRINHTDRRKIHDKQLMQLCELRIYDLMINTKNKVYKPQLSELYEQVKYNDKFGSCCTDEKIVGAILKLEDTFRAEQRNDEAIQKTMDELTALLAQRSIEMAEFKRGGF